MHNKWELEVTACKRATSTLFKISPFVFHLKKKVIRLERHEGESAKTDGTFIFAMN